MKSTFINTIALTASAVVYSHAIFGIGGQWAPAPSLEVKASKAEIFGSGANALSIDQAKVSGLQGVGVKLWVDVLPFIDIEGGSNVQFGYYDVTLLGPSDTKVPLKFDLKVPFVEGKPVFARIVNDLTVLYPFLKFPPLVSIVKLSAGAGITQVLSTSVLNTEFSKKAIAKANLPSTATMDEVSKALTKGIIDDGLSSGMGFHLEASAKAKIPVIPIAVFADVKYHFLNSMPKGVDGSSMTYELGGALAF